MAGKVSTQSASLSKGPIKPMQGLDRIQEKYVKADVPVAGATASVSPGTSAVANTGNVRDLAKRTEEVDDQGNVKLGTPKVYDSVGEAGSGFTNLSHLLALNKDSGARSANDLAARTKAAGQGALTGIAGLEGKFVDEARKGMSGFPNTEGFEGLEPDAQDKINAARNAAYTGPNDLTSMGAYSDLAKKVGSAQDMARNTQSGMGMAAQVNKETGLSPIQSAASAFYMGVNNPNIKRAGAQFTNLSKALDEANARAMSGAALAKQKARDLNDQSVGMQNRYNDLRDPANSANRFMEEDKAIEAEWNALMDSKSHGYNYISNQDPNWVQFGEWLKQQGLGGESATKDNYMKWKKSGGGK